MDVVLHIGMRKTATSSIQFFLRDNRARLREHGLLFPESPGRARHMRLGLFVKPDHELLRSIEWQREKQSDPARFRRLFRRRLFAEIESSGLDRVLFTDEVLFGSSAPALLRLGRFLSRFADGLRVVVYLRRQDDHLISSYQQEVKVGSIVRLRDWARQDMADLYDYDARMRRHERLVAPTEVVVRRYERGSFVGGSIYQDFLHAAGADVRADDLMQGPDRNESLDAESVEFLRLFNLYRVENDGATPGLIDNRQLTAQLADSFHGPVLSLPARWLDNFMDRWRESNEQVARRFLGDTSGELFRAPRKSSNITTEQRLDPARIDRFCTLLELPEPVHAPLRRLAEREASKRPDGG